ncbi:RNA polymerase sigma factor [Nocardioides dubius]
MLAGDEAGFLVVFRDVQPRLLRYLSVLVGAGEAEDVAAETWSQVVRDLARFRGDLDGFRGWVATIGRHRALDHLRQRQRSRIADVAVEDRPEPVGDDLAFLGASEALGTERAVAMIASLPREQAEAVMLRVVLGLDAASAAAVLGRRPGAVRTAAHRGLKALAAGLDERPALGVGNGIGTADAEGVS